MVNNDVEEVNGWVWREAVLPNSKADFSGKALERMEVGRLNILGDSLGHLAGCRLRVNVVGERRRPL